MPQRALELVRRFLGRQPAGGSLARRPERGPGTGLRFRYSFRSVELRGDEAHLVAEDHRYEDGRFESERLEGTVDGRSAPEALRALRRTVEERVDRLLQPLSGWLLPSRKGRGRE